MSILEAEKVARIRIIKYIIENQLKIDLCLRAISYNTFDAINPYLKNVVKKLKVTTLSNKTALLINKKFKTHF